MPLPYHGNIHPYKNRTIDVEKPLYVYRNLTRKNGRWYSLRQNGKVVAHALAVGLKDCQFIVGETVRKRILQTGQREVHAYIKGYFCDQAFCNYYRYNTTISYNPFKWASFVALEGFSPVWQAEGVVCDDTGVKGFKIA